MGRIKTKPVKRATNELLKEYPDKFTSNFDENKKLLADVLVTQSKKVRNTVAGYLTRQKKAGE